MMISNVVTEARRLNAIGDPLLFRIGLVGLVARYGAAEVRRALIDDIPAGGGNIASIFASRNWRPPGIRNPGQRRIG
jgi:hypothetical protein